MAADPFAGDEAVDPEEGGEAELLQGIVIIRNIGDHGTPRDLLGVERQLGHVKVGVTGGEDDIGLEVADEALQLGSFPAEDGPHKLAGQQSGVSEPLEASVFDRKPGSTRRFVTTDAIIPLIQRFAFSVGQQHGVGDLKILFANSILGKLSATVDLRDIRVRK